MRLVLCLVLLAACGDEAEPPVTCHHVNYSNIGGGYCVNSWKCSDDSFYDIECNDATNPPYTCTCFASGAAGRTFQSSDYCSREDPTRVMNAECGWSITLE
jgi:hypothetical protein